VAWAALIVSLGSAFLAAASLLVAIRRTRLSEQQFRHQRTARVAIAIGEIRRNGENWLVSLALTNVGSGNARHVEIWLEDSAGTWSSEKVRVGELLAGADGKTVVLEVPAERAPPEEVRPVRAYRDDLGPHTDPSEQVLRLALHPEGDDSNRTGAP
jgi:hypothetical protein